MTNYLIIENILRESNKPLSGDSIYYRAQQKNPKIARTTVSTILNKMKRKGKAQYEKIQASKRRIKLWKLTT